MFLTLCQELRELFQDDDLELTFSEDDDFSEDNFSARRHAAASKKSDYDPDADDYVMSVRPSEPGDDEEKKMIQHQIASLSSRISAGGAPEVLDHYHKVKEDLVLQLAMRGTCHKPAKLENDLESTLSTLSTCDTYPDDHIFIPPEKEDAVKFNMPTSGIMGPRARRLSGRAIFEGKDSDGQDAHDIA
ncbi:unnamed protein product [Symbiodinium pilosum]|uniref:Uncharacterized protein n=1 Tax=Symbiodinium pilosum TaxID=2952 RepID=A0A812W757_SYMPI|nr:unnamed protein product [Symbiodinium pilosum]